MLVRCRLQKKVGLEQIQANPIMGTRLKLLKN